MLRCFSLIFSWMPGSKGWSMRKLLLLFNYHNVNIFLLVSASSSGHTNSRYGIVYWNNHLQYCNARAQLFSNPVSCTLLYCYRMMFLSEFHMVITYVQMADSRGYWWWHFPHAFPLLQRLLRVDRPLHKFRAIRPTKVCIMCSLAA